MSVSLVIPVRMAAAAETRTVATRAPVARGITEITAKAVRNLCSLGLCFSVCFSKIFNISIMIIIAWNKEKKNGAPCSFTSNTPADSQIFKTEFIEYCSILETARTHFFVYVCTMQVVILYFWHVGHQYY